MTTVHLDQGSDLDHTETRSCSRSRVIIENLEGQLPIDEMFICDPTPRNESLCAFEKSEKKGKVKKNCFL
jgi:hypothetical protein